MTLKEAIESGRPFRRRGWGYWFTATDDGLYAPENNTVVKITKSDVLADDYILEPVSKQITGADIVAAVDRLFAHTVERVTYVDNPTHRGGLADVLIAELGL